MARETDQEERDRKDQVKIDENNTRQARLGPEVVASEPPPAKKAPRVRKSRAKTGTTRAKGSKKET